ncbi:MAG: 2-hydroxyglutaryl-CoA dehydratase [Acidobacteria bacterium]|nr:MAG: 2-hydroxyglutaryl-CoA dehydratase [Acidobacteriota bacterium]
MPMPDRSHRLGAGIDAGTECVKAVVVEPSGRIRGRAVVPTTGYFETAAQAALAAALEDAQLDLGDLAVVAATGFGAECVPNAVVTVAETAAHARGAFAHRRSPMTVIDIGGRDPKAITVDARGRRVDARTTRRCAMGIGTFLAFTARHLDVHPSRLQELAATAESPAVISSYCSVFAGTEVLERLRNGARREEIALGCIHSIAERIIEIGALEPPLVATGGVPEYFPGVVRELSRLLGSEVEVIPEPIVAGAVGAALLALEAGEGERKGGDGAAQASS